MGFSVTTFTVINDASALLALLANRGRRSIAHSMHTLKLTIDRRHLERGSDEYIEWKNETTGH